MIIFLKVTKLRVFNICPSATIKSSIYSEQRRNILIIALSKSPFIKIFTYFILDESRKSQLMGKKRKDFNILLSLVQFYKLKHYQFQISTIIIQTYQLSIINIINQSKTKKKKSLTQINSFRIYNLLVNILQIKYIFIYNP